MEETRVIYHVDDQKTPYLMKLPKASDRFTLLDLKNALNRFNCKFFFKSVDADFGVVKEEIVDDVMVLPSVNGRIVTWLVTSDSSVSDTHSQCAEAVPQKATVTNVQTSAKAYPKGKPERLTSAGCVTNMTSEQGPPQPLSPVNHPKSAQHNPGFDGGSSIMSSDIETTSFVDSGDETSTRFSTTTETTHRSTKHTRRQKRHRRLPVLSQASSFSSITDSAMSLNIVTVQLNMESSNFLGISIVGQSGISGDGGVYVGCIMKGGAVALDGRIEPGDMILEVNGISFENMSNDEAVLALRGAIKRPGPITLVVAKCWDPNPKGYFMTPRQEPVRPKDPSAWVSQTAPGMWNNRGGTPSMSSMTSVTSSIISSLPPNEYVHRLNHSSSSSHSSKNFSDLNLTKTADMATIVRAMAQPDSGLEVRDRMWLKIKIPQSFIGEELVDWLFTRIQGFADRRDARRYACNLLKFGYIQHTVGKPSFSEQCYYIFSTSTCAADRMPAMLLDDVDSVSSVDPHEREVLRSFPTPPPVWNAPFIAPRPTAPKAPPQQISTPSYNPTAHIYVNETASYVSMPRFNGAESVVSESVRHDKTCACIATHTFKQFKKLWDNPVKIGAAQSSNKMAGKFDPDIDRSTSSDTESSDSEAEVCRQKGRRMDATSSDAKHSAEQSLCSPPPNNLSAANTEICASRQSFRLAMSNAYKDESLHMMGDF